MSLQDTYVLISFVASGLFGFLLAYLLCTSRGRR
jgi:hypothetical protein